MTVRIAGPAGTLANRNDPSLSVIALISVPTMRTSARDAYSLVSRFRTRPAIIPAGCAAAATVSAAGIDAAAALTTAIHRTRAKEKICFMGVGKARLRR